MDTPRGPNNTLKRRRLDEEASPNVQGTGHPALTTGYQAGYRSYTRPFEVQQFYPNSVSQPVSATLQPNARGAYSTISPHHNNAWTPYHSFQSQNAAGGFLNDKSFQAAFPNLQPPSTSFASPSFELWSSMSMGHLMPQEQTQHYGQLLPKSSCQQHLLDSAQSSSNVQPWQSTMCVEAQILDISTIIAVDNSLPAAPAPARQVLEEQEPEKVCFGMVPSISARCDPKSSLNTPPSPFSVQIKTSPSSDSPKFISEEYPEISGHIMSDHGQMIQSLLEDETLDLYVSCTIPDSQSPTQQKTRSSPLQCTLEITVYGPSDLFDEIGEWFEEYQVYLQDPRECHIDVKYYNPHRLSSDDFASCDLVSEVVSRGSKILHLESIPQQKDLLDDLDSQDDLEETAQPTVIKRSLRKHQKQALTFMLRREQGWAFYDQRPDVWEMRENDRERFFLNRISNAYQAEEPPQCYGGIIADPMGLGKTLTMIALAATDLDRDNTEMDTSEDGQLSVAATLIVVPPPLIGTWEEQLSEHVVHGGMAWHRHHRETRLSSTTELDRFNIVLTTYHTVSAEWNSGNGVRDSTLFSVRWERIILDEAHLIRNANSKMSQAVCALDSKSRWAVTGTPIQNRLGDLATLFKFIRAHPYTDQRRFDIDISRLWKSGEYEEAIKRLKRLSACMLLRRPKGTVDLPARRDMQCPVNFNTEERALYDKLRNETLTNIKEALKGDMERSRTGLYVNVLQQIESLRLVCNLGLHYHTRHGKDPAASLEGDTWASNAQGTFNVQREMEPPVCIQCGSTLEITETLLEDPSVPRQSAQFFSCLKFVCADCTQRQSRGVLECGHNPRCSVASVSTNSSALESSPEEIQTQTRATSIGLSSKVEALITDIKALPWNDKCIVFSSWRLTLDMVEAGLEQASIPSVRFDGKVPQNERQEIVERFRSNPLTLTVATRAYLMEPHWNPTLEEQALARIHRIGQTREVTTVRFYMRDSFEQHVMGVQESKKHLAGLLLSPHDGEQADESQGRLEKLRSLI
ncbi:Helicase ATP-binding domain-containing protein [Fusarium falciforme]|uniref:Helicase ATP-binding domain-containing protein n=1 Tax=Fusarium falciforme TaxID=195108 RepID=UPI0023016A46|nr:Helicase ATP-binding domain-containing protein [Fusarium falciforme]WAO86157.1 Helicase ATP-binding domain-containing protein [Fusarium falciforme]